MTHRGRLRLLGQGRGASVSVQLQIDAVDLPGRSMNSKNLAQSIQANPSSTPIRANVKFVTTQYRAERQKSSGLQRYKGKTCGVIREWPMVQSTNRPEGGRTGLPGTQPSARHGRIRNGTAKSWLSSSAMAPCSVANGCGPSGCRTINVVTALAICGGQRPARSRP